MDHGHSLQKKFLSVFCQVPGMDTAYGMNIVSAVFVRKELLFEIRKKCIFFGILATILAICFLYLDGNSSWEALFLVSGDHTEGKDLLVAFLTRSFLFTRGTIPYLLLTEENENIANV